MIKAWIDKKMDEKLLIVALTIGHIKEVDNQKENQDLTMLLEYATIKKKEQMFVKEGTV